MFVPQNGGGRLHRPHQERENRKRQGGRKSGQKDRAVGHVPLPESPGDQGTRALGQCKGRKMEPGRQARMVRADEKSREGLPDSAGSPESPKSKGVQEQGGKKGGGEREAEKGQKGEDLKDEDAF